MPAASLDGLVIDKPHALALEDITRRIELAADDLAKGMLSNHNPRIEKPAPQRILLSGGKGGSAFQAQISIEAQAVKVEVNGKLELSTLTLFAAGGEAGVRKRVRSEIEQALNERIAAA